MSNSGIPYVELYRPKYFDDIVLDPLNKQILKNIIENSYFPNLLFYGPPGTGKTTTIINLINAYQENQNNKNKDLIIHLNASDERGIDIIRNQISNFVNSKPLFNNGMKFVILDEVDYMTKNAQQALRYLLQNYTNKVRFCLICNYISKIDEGLQNEFIRLRFNQLPREDIINFLNNISVKEGLGLSQKILSCIQQLYKSDIRSMINFIQSNQNLDSELLNIIDSDIWESLLNKILSRDGLESITGYIHTISINYNIDKKNIIKDFLNYIIKHHHNRINSKLLDFVENLMHTKNQNINTYINYSISQLTSLLSI
jgi:replication factor C subunit 3/5